MSTNSRALRVLHVTPRFFPYMGGIETHVHEVGRRLVLAVFAAGVTLTTLSTVLDQIFVAERASGNMLIRNAIFAALKIPLLVLPFAFIHIGALGILLSWIVTAAVAVVLSLLILVPRLGRHYRPRLRGILADIRTMRASLFAQHLINIGGVAPMYVIPILVTVRVSATDSAYYYTTWMLGSVFFMISSSVGTALFSEGSHVADHLPGKVRSSAKLIAALLVPMMIIFLVGGRAILGVFGPDYAQHSVLLLDILVLAAIPDAITNIFVSALRVRGRLRYAALLNVGMAALALLLAWLLLPRMGIAGGGLAWMIGQSAGCVVVLVALVRIPLPASLGRRHALAPHAPFFSDASDESPFGDYVAMRDAAHTSEHIAVLSSEHLALMSIDGAQIQMSSNVAQAPDMRVGDITLIRKKPIATRNAQPNELTVGIPSNAARNYTQLDSDTAWGDLADTLVMRAVNRG